MAKMVGELILDNDEVSLPGVGTFVAEVMPSTFSDKGYTINPPYRRLSFRQRETSDGLLAGLYARSNGVDEEMATSILTTFLAEMRETLKTRKTIVFPGLGRLRATRENNFFFIPDEDLNIYPEGFGLEPLSLKTHVETEDEMRAAVASLQQIMEEPAEEKVEVETPVEEVVAAEEVPVAEEPVEEAEAVEEEKVTEEEPVEEQIVEEVKEAPEVPETPVASEMPAAQERPERPTRKSVEEEGDYSWFEEDYKAWRRGRVLWITGIVLVVLLVLLLVAVFVLGRVAPDFIDRFLYTREELEIVRQII